MDARRGGRLAEHAETTTLALSLALALVVAVHAPGTYGDGVDPREVNHLPAWITVGLPSLFAPEPLPGGVPSMKTVSAPEAPTGGTPGVAPAAAPTPPKDWGRDPWAAPSAPRAKPAAAPAPADPWDRERAERLGKAP